MAANHVVHRDLSHPISDKRKGADEALKCLMTETVIALASSVRGPKPTRAIIPAVSALGARVDIGAAERDFRV
jgi:hypothetical protein